MSMSDPLGDMLTRIRNAQRARHTACVAPASKLRANVLDALKRVSILSTPRGVLSDAEARAANVGGEVLCRVF
jgi:ribosomal protein S8